MGHVGNALAILLAALQKTMCVEDQYFKMLIDSALVAHTQQTHDVSDVMSSVVFCHSQKSLAQTSLP